MNTPLRLAMVRVSLSVHSRRWRTRRAWSARDRTYISKSTFRGTDALQIESKSVSRILFPDLQISNLEFEIGDLKIGAAIIPLAQPLPVGSSDLPGGLERAARFLKSQISNLKSQDASLFGLAPR